MAPSRRKGANKAAAAAAARRKWKVGDLVLAKVKGFPAWPAKVSEPEKWGYRADKKKVVVHFFGTEQIAFCNPIDVEEFTEEKKVTLLGKRHGKGADFVRAVNEIIDCFEKLKALDQVSSVNGTEETDITNENQSEESLTNPLKENAATIAVKPCSVGTMNDLNSLTEAAVAAAARDTLHDEEMQLGNAHSNLAFSETPASTTYSTRSKSKLSQSQKNGAKERVSARRLRSSSRIDASRRKKLVLPSVSNTRSSRRSTTNAFHDRYLRRSKRIVKSPDDSKGSGVDSPACLSSDSIEENDSDDVTVDSDTLSFKDGSFNDGSTVDSGCKPVGLKSFPENKDGETEVSDRLDFQANAIVIKKKRKLNRKRHRNGNVVTAKLDGVVPEAEALKDECVSPGNNKKLLIERYAQHNGDEHLPLVKRARVRMSRSAGEDGDTFLSKEEGSVLASESGAASSSEPLTCELDAPADMESIPNKADPTSSSVSYVNPSKKSQYLDSRKKFTDGEAALPPSKRLHRALQAMSANVAEDTEKSSKCSPLGNTQSIGNSSSCGNCTDLLVGNKADIDLGSGQIPDHIHDHSQLNASECCIQTDVELSQNGTKACDIDGSNTDVCYHSVEHQEGANNKGLQTPMLDERPAENAAKNPVEMEPPDAGEELADSDCNGSALISPTDGSIVGHLEFQEAHKGPYTDIPDLKSESILVGEIGVDPLNIDTSNWIGSANKEGNEAHSEDHPPLAENSQESSRSVFIEGDGSASMNSVVMPSATPILTSEYRGSLLGPGSVSNDHQEDRTVSITQFSSSPTEGPDFCARSSVPGSSVCDVSAVENRSYHENTSYCGSDVQLHLEKAKLAGKLSNKSESLSSFEAILRSLTRTKESIGCATRVAIDCAKFGFATKVVEILAHNLETESSLHKKVDLFFLVDSITQRSRGMKGDGGVYPSAIQAMLPRLLLAAAPPGSSSHENHRQCLKVLRVWQERKILPEPIIRHHIRELDALCGPYPPTGGSRRPLRNERAFDDPIRQMEGMLVDEYGSNSSFQLLGFCMPPMLKDDGGVSDSDGESFEAVTPEHNVENIDGEKSTIPAIEKRSHILEDVDGELEMEDVAPCCEVETTSSCNIVGADRAQTAWCQSDNRFGPSFRPQKPEDGPRCPAPLSISPPPPPPSHSIPQSAFLPVVNDSVSNGPESNLYPSSQNFSSSVPDTMLKQSAPQRVKSTLSDASRHRSYNNNDFESLVPRHRFDDNKDCSFSERSATHIPDRGSNNIQPSEGAFSKGFHLRPPYPSPSNQFSYVREQRLQSRREIAPPSHPNRFHNRNENGNFYQDRDRNKFPSRDNIGECWRPPLPSISGPCYNEVARMGQAPISYGGPLREPPFPNSRWNCPPQPPNHRHFNPYRPPYEGPIPVGNRGPNNWRPR